MWKGLKSGIVRLEKNHDEWATYFTRTSRRIEQALADIVCSVEHVGSTAIPGIAAKPIVDIAIGLGNMSQHEIVVKKLESVGCRYRGYRSDSGGHVFDMLEQDFALSYVHLVTLGGEQWNRYILFRDYLRLSITARKRYEKVKYDLVQRFPEERKHYAAAKKTTIDTLYDEAKRSLMTLEQSVRQSTK